MNILQIISNILKVEVNTDSTQDNTPEWDSVKHIEVVMALEEQHGIRFDEAQIMGVSSVRGLIEMIEGRE